MAIAEHETRLGDVWPGEHNWGGIHKRSLSAVERSFLDARGIVASGGAAALQAARGLLPHAADEALHIDRSPVSGPYFVWFWAFPDDASAARKFLQVLLVQRPNVREVLEHDDPRAVAAAMYDARYYEGAHKGDRDANINDYARRIAALEALISSALAPSPAPLPPPTFPQASAPPSPPFQPTAYPYGVPYQPAMYAPGTGVLPPFPPPAPTTFPPPPPFSPPPTTPIAAAAGSVGAVLVLAGIVAAGVAIARAGGQ
jgi:hypothetical protein